MKRKEGGLSCLPLHTRSNGWLKNLHSVIQNTRCFNSGKFATIANRAGLRTINDSPQATAKYSLTIQAKGELDQSSVVRNFRTTAANGKAYDVTHYDQGPSRHQVSTMWAPSRSTARVTGQVPRQVDPWVIRALIACSVKPISSREIQESTGLRHRETFQRNYLDQLISDGLVELTIPEKPTSRLQKYRLTDKGRRLLTRLDKEGGRT